MTPLRFLFVCLVIWGLAQIYLAFDGLWWLVARLLARPAITGWLIRRFATPDRAFPIHDADGSLYMERFLISQHPWAPFSLRLHHIVRRDNDLHPHDHPWWFRTFLLRGYYVETFADGGDVEHEAGSTHEMPRGEFHRIIIVPPEGVWTLVIFGRRSEPWGFLVAGRKVHYKTYLDRRPKPLTAADWGLEDEPQ